jgi:hypothetical protein
MGPISYPEPPLPPELQAEIEASMLRFKDMWPGFLQHVTEEYAPRYRAEITTLIRKTLRVAQVEHEKKLNSGVYSGFYQRGITVSDATPQRADTPDRHEAEEIPKAI